MHCIFCEMANCKPYEVTMSVPQETVLTDRKAAISIAEDHVSTRIKHSEVK